MNKNKSRWIAAALFSVTCGSLLGQEVGYKGFHGIVLSDDPTQVESPTPVVSNIETTSINVAAGTQGSVSHAMVWRLLQNDIFGWISWTRDLTSTFETAFPSNQYEYPLDSRATGVTYSTTNTAVYAVGDVKSVVDSGASVDHSFVAKLNPSNGTVSAIVYQPKSDYWVRDVAVLGADVFTVGTDDGDLEVDERSANCVVSDTYNSSGGTCLPRVIAASSQGGVTTLYVGGSFTGTVTFDTGMSASSSNWSPFVLQLEFVGGVIEPVELWYSSGVGEVRDLEVASTGASVYVAGVLRDSGGNQRPVMVMNASSIGTSPWFDQDTTAPTFADAIGLRVINGIDRVTTQTVYNQFGLGQATNLVYVHYAGKNRLKRYSHQLKSSPEAMTVASLSLDGFANLWFGGTLIEGPSDFDARASSASLDPETPPTIVAIKWFNAILLAATVTVTQGTASQTGLDRLQAQDDVRVDVSATSPTDVTQVEFSTVIDPDSGIASLSVFVEAQASITAGEVLQLYNYNTSSWETISSRSVGTSDTSHAYNPTGTLSRFVDGSGNMKARLTYTATSEPQSRFTSRIDHFRWHVTN